MEGSLKGERDEFSRQSFEEVGEKRRAGNLVSVGPGQLSVRLAAKT